MAILKLLRYWLFVGLLLLSTAAQASGDFVVLCYHDVEKDSTSPLSSMAVHAGDLAAQFAWLQANGYHPVSVQQVLDARMGGKALPEKAVMLTFDDGKKDVYTRVFPLLKLFRYPAVVALVGRWLDVPAGDAVDYDGRELPRNEFVSWQEVREMQASGLVEIASHSYDLHRSVLANPQGNTQPAAISRIYAAGHYESDEEYLERLRNDLRRNSELIAQQTGSAPRVMVWPYGRSNAAARQVAEDLGMPVGMTLVDGINQPQTPLSVLKRYLIEDSPSLQSYAEAMRHVWSPDPARSVRIVPAEWADSEEGLSRVLDRLQRWRVNISFVDPQQMQRGKMLPLFPSAQFPEARDELNRIAWQIERRAGSPVFIDIPAAWLGNPELLADLARQVNFAGIRLPLVPGDAQAKRVLEVMQRWRWPLQIAYAPAQPVSVAGDKALWQHLRPGDLLVLPATHENIAAVPVAESGKLLFEFDPETQPGADIARAMRVIEADGWRQFGLTSFPDVGLEAIRPALSLRSQPLLP